MEEKHSEKKLGTDILQNSLIIPHILLQRYYKVGLTDLEMLVLLRLMSIDKEEIKKQDYLSILPESMSSGRIEIKNAVASLMEKGLLTIDGEPKMAQIYDAIQEIWDSDTVGHKSLGKQSAENLYTVFEQEFGRLLTPMEANQINAWITDDNYDQDLIKEALKRSVLRGILNFKYVDSILREWSKKSLKTIKEVNALERNYEKKKNAPKKQPKEKNAEDKYHHIYMRDLGRD